MCSSSSCFPPKGGSLGSFQTNEADRQAGETLIGRGNRRYRIIAVIPLEPTGELVAEPDGVPEVEPTQIRDGVIKANEADVCAALRSRRSRLSYRDRSRTATTGDSTRAAA
jgi:hypothetical protein